MTKKLTDQEKKDNAKKRKQQKAPSTTVKTVTVPKHEGPAEPPADPVNLCDDCAYEFGDCEGKPKFASDQDETLTGAEADRVIECPAFVDVSKMPTAQETRQGAAGPGAAPEEPNLILVCSGGCGKTTEGMTYETRSGEFEDSEEEHIPVKWTCQECLDTEEPEPEVKVIRTDLPQRPDPKRFNKEEDLGTCQSCERPLKRTALNRYQDAVRCTNPRCRAYRVIVRHISTGVK